MIASTTAEYAELVADLSRRGPTQLRIETPSGTYAEIIAGVALTWAPRSTVPITADRLAWLLTGIGWRETELGTARACRPSGPGCAGDYTARAVTARRGAGRHRIVHAIDLPPGWHVPAELAGQPVAIPLDGLGFGRDEWQADYDAHPEVTDARDALGRLCYIDSRWACHQAAWRYLADLAALGDERQALAAYNCGVGGVRKALAAKLDIDAHTTGGDYSRWVLEHVSRWTA